MVQKIGIWQLGGKERSQRMAAALTAGARRAGMHPVVRMDKNYTEPVEMVAAFYGYQGNMPRIMADYVASGRTVIFVDLGYWHRRKGGRWEGYHKVSINARHPDAYMMDKPRKSDRIRQMGVEVRDWQRNGHHILLAGMSGKSAESYGMQPEEWERWAVAKLRKVTKRPIIYRPKPNWLGARPIDGAVMAPRQSLTDALRGCHAVVTHHSNVAIDAIAAGIPAFCMEGAARLMSKQRLSEIDDPWRPDGREQWLANLAYCQWSTEEIRGAALWKFLQAEGII